MVIIIDIMIMLIKMISSIIMMKLMPVEVK